LENSEISNVLLGFTKNVQPNLQLQLVFCHFETAGGAVEESAFVSHLKRDNRSCRKGEITGGKDAAVIESVLVGFTNII